ncbi:unnamed protein product [Dovyalis caffra]|uniref:GDSL esterase/lipase n=1 Tax=Dovyalis caffra TaxID=77055 RepID=A0AAV1RR00_9ROSI|nr:unnamed protein product [Dovyalis caffra]
MGINRNNNFRNLTINDKANYWPYGGTFFSSPTGRFSDGLLVPDFLAMKLKIPLWKPYLASGGEHEFLHGAKFAGGGSAALGDLGIPGRKVATVLKQSLGDMEAKKLLMEAVYAFSIGTNDYASFAKTYPFANATKQQEYVHMVIGKLTDVIKEIYKIGGRKFAMHNVGPWGCMPRLRQYFGLSNNKCHDGLLTIARMHNDALSNAAMEIESQLAGFKYLIFDVYNSALIRIERFKESIIAYRGNNCGIEPYELCSNPNDHIFFHGAHPTEHCYKQMARLIWEGGPNVTKPYNMKQLFALEVKDIEN